MAKRKMRKRAGRGPDPFKVMALLVPLFGGVAYVVLAMLQQHLYSELGLQPADVGLDHSRIYDETIGLMACIAVVFAVAAGCITLVARKTKSVEVSSYLLAALVFLAATAGVMVATWREGTVLAHDVKYGYNVSGKAAGGLRLLDLDAQPFRFTKLAAHHSFDRGCMLYLGRANGYIVFFNVALGHARKLSENQYDGDVLGSDVRRVPARCLASPIGTPLISAAQVADVDASAKTIVWSERLRADGPWWLMAWADGRQRPLTASRHPLESDLGRDASGRSTVTYRACDNDGCRLRSRRVDDASVHTVAAPRLSGCEQHDPVEDTGVTAVLMSGRRCPVAERGIWMRRTSERWRRVPTSGGATGELDAYDHQVVWVEVRGPLARLRSLHGTRPTTLFSTSPLEGRQERAAIRSVNVDARTVGWTARVEDGPTVYYGLDNTGKTCLATQRLLPLGATAVAYEADHALLITASRIYEGPIEPDGIWHEFDVRASSNDLGDTFCPRRH